MREEAKASRHSGSLHGPGVRRSVIRALLRAGADVNRVFISEEGWVSTPLLAATEEGSIETVQTLIEGGAKINANPDGTGTALILAARRGRTELVRLLLEAGASVHEVSADCGTALTCAVSSGPLEIVTDLLKAGATPNAVRNGRTVLMLAVGRPEAMHALIGARADVHAKARFSRTALIWAAIEGSSESASLLLKAGADVNATDEMGWTALKWAVELNRKELVEVLEKAGGRR